MNGIWFGRGRSSLGQLATGQTEPTPPYKLARGGTRLITQFILTLAIVLVLIPLGIDTPSLTGKLLARDEELRSGSPGGTARPWRAATPCPPCDGRLLGRGTDAPAA